ncbi:hypothetical protein [Sorangium sp. So ce1335]|uniref:hypothetical protein n=1 Tax=Sorangium sp. So ce1335 TaxID=3133335 RepID=UPI003F6064F5
MGTVFDGAAQREGLWYAAPTQVALDLLTSPGRGPQEGEEPEQLGIEAGFDSHARRSRDSMKNIGVTTPGTGSC